MGLFKKVETDVLADIKQGAADVLGWFHDALDQLEVVVSDAADVAAQEAAKVDHHLARKADAEKVVSETQAVVANFKSLLNKPAS